MSPGNITRAWDCFYTLNRDFLYFVVLSSQRGYHTILWTNIIVLNQWNTKAEVPAGSVFLCTGKSYSSFLSTTKRDPLNVLSYVEQKVSEKAEKQCCKKDITQYITQIYQIWRLNKCICGNSFRSFINIRINSCRRLVSKMWKSRLLCTWKTAFAGCWFSDICKGKKYKALILK